MIHFLIQHRCEIMNNNVDVHESITVSMYYSSHIQIKLAMESEVIWLPIDVYNI